MALNDKSLMPFGKYKGKAMANVPADYLLWLYDNGLKNGDVKAYIIDNMEVLQSETKTIKPNKYDEQSIQDP